MEKKILVVDDEPDILKALKLRLESAGYEVVTAEDGEKGLEIAHNENPDLIVLDVIMPKMDGYTFVRNMRADKSIKDLPIIVCTAREKMQDLFEIEGVKDYVIKPFEIEELLDKIKNNIKI